MTGNFKNQYWSKLQPPLVGQPEQFPVPPQLKMLVEVLLCQQKADSSQE